MSVPPEIIAHYEVYDEASRLQSGGGLLERDRTRELLDRFLPPVPAKVLDVGGGTGVHALWLAGRGYEVDLIDPIPSHITRAREASEAQPNHPIAGFVVGVAGDLPYDDSSSDAVLLLGPLYHLVERDDRLAALREAGRVLRSGGIVVAAAISRFASLLDSMDRELYEDPVFCEIVASDVATGWHVNPTDNVDYFTTAYLHRAEELRDEFEAAGLRHQTTVAVEGPACLLHDIDDRWSDPNRRERLLAAVRSIETEPALLGASAHLLAIGVA
jgi:ubiquinone/menaquinone biosynthesis C-methylase UbiE